MRVPAGTPSRIDGDTRHSSSTVLKCGPRLLRSPPPPCFQMSVPQGRVIDKGLGFLNSGSTGILHNHNLPLPRLARARRLGTDQVRKAARKWPPYCTTGGLRPHPRQHKDPPPSGTMGCHFWVWVFWGPRVQGR